MSADDHAADSTRGRLEEDDHDLLTFGEAGERLRIEIASMAQQIAQLEASGDTDGLRNAKERLAALRAAAARNTAQPINDANFEKFFGYAGKPKRNLAGPVGE
ncbi:acyl-CoA synthetase [uncultured Mycobacterium sp.]|uniref:acyl-CoA synthetase n=1 Tax=uncultured Mycobacterium sp. TaxID=171292 RepID=UPI0035CC3E7D